MNDGGVPSPPPPLVAIVGAGPAGLMAAEALTATAGGALRVHVFDAMPSVGRKFLMAGKSGLNLTHAEPFEAFLGRFGAARERLAPALTAFGPAEVRDWAAGLGIETFVGSSGRVFPTDFKAAPLLRAWLRRLRAAGVQIHVRHRWAGWSDGDGSGGGALAFETPQGRVEVAADATVLALGGASWPRLGSDAAWAPLLRRRGVAVTPLRPANCGFDVAGAWSAPFRERFAGAPVKAVALTGPDGKRTRGEFVITETGIEGSAVYAHSAALRDAIEAAADEPPPVMLTLDLAPDRDPARLTRDVSGPRGGRSLSNHLRRAAGIEGVKAGLLRECLSAETLNDAGRLAAAIKALPLRLTAPRPIEEAISSAGGVALGALDGNWMLLDLPGTSCAGEMLDWEAPTGGYLLTACMALGRAAGLGTAAWLRERTGSGAVQDRAAPA
jgi:hypothetical protein